MIGVGVIGAGVMGRCHAEIFGRKTSGARLIAVSDPDTSRAKDTAQIADGAQCFAQGHDVISHPDVDAVVIAAPDVAHREFVFACLEAGKPVLCEKPLAPSRIECREIVDHPRSDLVSVGFMRRFDPAYIAMKAALDKGEIGTIVAAHCRHRNASAPAWFTTDMVVTNALVHELDIMRWLIGSEFSGVHIARVSDSRPDLVMLMLETFQGMTISVEVFMNARYGYDVQTELVGDIGTLTLSKPALVELFQDGSARKGYTENWIPRFMSAYENQAKSWIYHLQNGEKSSIACANDGLVASGYAETIVELLATGNRYGAL